MGTSDKNIAPFFYRWIDFTYFQIHPQSNSPFHKENNALVSDKPSIWAALYHHMPVMPIAQQFLFWRRSSLRHIQIPACFFPIPLLSWNKLSPAIQDALVGVLRHPVPENEKDLKGC